MRKKADEEKGKFGIVLKNMKNSEKPCQWIIYEIVYHVTAHAAYFSNFVVEVVIAIYTTKNAEKLSFRVLFSY